MIIIFAASDQDVQQMCVTNKVRGTLIQVVIITKESLKKFDVCLMLDVYR